MTARAGHWARRGPAVGQGQWPAATGALLPAAEPPERKSGYRMVQPPSAAFFSAVVLLRVDYSSLRMTFDGIDNAAEAGGSRPSRRQFEPSRAPGRSAAPTGHSREPDFRTRPYSQARGRTPGRAGRGRLRLAWPGRHLVVLVVLGRADRLHGGPRRRLGQDRAGAHQADLGLAGISLGVTGSVCRVPGRTGQV